MSRAEEAMATLVSEMARLERENAELVRQVNLLGRANDDACDTIHELREMLERSYAVSA